MSTQTTLGRRSEDAYRSQWRWDRVTWGSHCVDCYPGNCPMRVYVRDGVVWREEQAGTYRPVEAGVPDMNPMGCQKGVAWREVQYGPERLLHPLKRAGERGEGRWQQISWHQALTEVADGLLDAIEEGGPESILGETIPAQGGMVGTLAYSRFLHLLGAITMDLECIINDLNAGMYVTFGKFNVSSVDDWFHSQLVLIWHMNPVYTRIPYYHYVAEARYDGAEVVTIAPDYSPSAVHADQHVPVAPGTDAALALGMCRVIIDEGLVDEAFVREQTDLPLLVRVDSGRFLRQSDLEPDGRDDQFYVFDRRTGGIVFAPRGDLQLGDLDPALEGSYRVRLGDGTDAEAAPAFALLRTHLQPYAPEAASAICGTHPDTIRALARRVAACRTNILLGFNSAKYYHGDLMERAMCLLLALTGNWGRQGTGIRSWSTGPFDAPYVFSAKGRAGPEATLEVLALRKRLLAEAKTADPTSTEEMATIALGQAVLLQGRMLPPFEIWYRHAGYADRWNTEAWGESTQGRGFDGWLAEAREQGWWQGLTGPESVEPRVFLSVGGNLLRRNRGGRHALLPTLWKKLQMVVAVDCRMSATALYADYVLPAATHHEKTNFHYSTPHVLQALFADKAVEPPGEARSEWQILQALAQRLGERGRERGITTTVDSRGVERSLVDLYQAFTLDGAFTEDEAVVREWVDDAVLMDVVPAETTIDTFRRRGFVRCIGWGVSPFGYAQASDLRRDETHASFRWHVERGLPYPTVTRRAQFYIDHEWFLQAGEAFPVHKDNPKMGGDYPLSMTSGHNRWSIHAANIANRLMLQTHRGVPFVFLSESDAAARQIGDGERVRVRNDVSSFVAQAKVSAGTRPGQVVMYNGWEPYMFEGWEDPAGVEPGMVKWLHLAGGYGQVAYRPGCWQPVMVDRGTRVEVERA